MLGENPNITDGNRDLVLLLIRAARCLSRHDDGKQLSGQIKDYLARKELIPSVLRETVFCPPGDIGNNDR